MKWSTQQESKHALFSSNTISRDRKYFLAFCVDFFLDRRSFKNEKLKIENCPSQVISIVSVALLVIAVSTDNWLSYEVKRKNIMVIMTTPIFFYQLINYEVLRSFCVSNILELHPSPILYFFQSAFLDSLFFSLLMFVHNTNSNFKLRPSINSIAMIHKGEPRAFKM